MTMRYKNQTIMYDNNADIPAPHDTVPLEDTPPTQSIPEQDGEVTAKYSEDPNHQRDLAQFQEHFKQLQE